MVEVNEVSEWRIVFVDEERIVNVSNEEELMEQIKEFSRDLGFQTIKVKLDRDSHTAYVFPVEKPA